MYTTWLVVSIFAILAGLASALNNDLSGEEQPLPSDVKSYADVFASFLFKVENATQDQCLKASAEITPIYLKPLQGGASRTTKKVSPRKTSTWLNVPVSTQKNQQDYAATMYCEESSQLNVSTIISLAPSVYCDPGQEQSKGLHMQWKLDWATPNGPCQWYPVLNAADVTRLDMARVCGCKNVPTYELGVNTVTS